MGYCLLCATLLSYVNLIHQGDSSMPTLVIVDLTPIDKTLLSEYSALAAETLKPFKGRFMAKGAIDVLHGEANHPMKVVIEFPDKDSAKGWYSSAEYQAIIPLREQGMRSQFHLV